MKQAGLSRWTAAEILKSIDGIAGLLAAEAETAERERRLSARSVAALKAAGVYSIWTPAALGGAQLDLGSGLKVIEALARVDPASAWVLFVASGGNIASSRMSDEAAREVYSRPGNLLCGAINPPGRLAVTEGGYRLTGRWPYASGIEHADWVLLLAAPDAPVAVGAGPAGTGPLLCIVQPSDITIHDTWHTLGLRGTGSHDVEARDVPVPPHRIFRVRAADDPRSAYHQGPLYRIPLAAGLGTPNAAVALGIARAAIDHMIAIATAKTPVGRTSPLRDQPVMQGEIARAEALVRSGRAWLHETAGRITAKAEAGDALPLELRRDLLLASVNAAQAASEAVDLMHRAAGGTAVYARSPIERLFRDMHTLIAHRRAAPLQYEVAGRSMLGLDPGDPAMLQ